MLACANHKIVSSEENVNNALARHPRVGFTLLPQKQNILDVGFLLESPQRSVPETPPAPYR